MAEIARMWATVGADASGFKREMDGVSQRVNGFSQTMDMMKGAVIAGFAAVTAAVAGAGFSVAKTGLDFLAMKEQSQIAFTTMLGSGTLAQKMLDDLAAFAAKTPFEFQDLTRATQRMMAMGFSSEEVIPILTAVGDAVAGLGGGAVEVDRVTRALGQMQAKGKTSAEEMMQLTEAGIPAWQMLADKIGVAVPEAMKLVQKGAISADTTIGAVVDGMNERFGGMMEKQSTTWNGLLSNLKDIFAQISGSVMKPFFEMGKAGLERLVAAATAFFEAIKAGKKPFDALQEAMQKLLPEDAFARWEAFRIKLEEVIAGIRDFSKPILDAIGKFLSWKDVVMAVGIFIAGAIASIVASMMPMIAALALVTAAVAAFRYAWENDLGGIRTFTKNTVENISRWFFTESGIWQGTWEETGEYILDRVRYFFEIAIPYAFHGFTSGTKFLFQQWSIKTRDLMLEWSLKIRETVLHWASVVQYQFSHTKDLIIEAWNKWIQPTIKSITDWVAVTKSKLGHYYGWVEKYFGDAKDWIIEKWRQILDWWDSNVQPWVDKAYDLGKNVLRGLREGMQDAWDTLKRWWDGIWDKDLTKTVQVKMQTHSPSKVMEELGKNVMQGFGIGAQKMLPYVENVMGGISTASINAGAAGGGGMSTARIEELLTILIQELRAKNMNVTVNGSGGGDNYGALVGFTAGTH